MTRGLVMGLTAVLCVLAALFSAGSAAAATGEIHGKVTDHLGEPIEGITVCAEGLTPLVGNECAWHTDSDGEYSIGGLREASYRVGFHVESNPSLNYVQQWYSGKAHPEEADPVELADGESKEINAQLQTGGKIEGTVADENTDEPIEGVQVCAQMIGFFQDGEVATAATAIRRANSPSRTWAQVSTGSNSGPKGTSTTSKSNCPKRQARFP